MATVYVSYKLEDRSLAERLGAELKRHGHEAIYDAVALTPGEDWRAVLMKALSAADAVVVLLTDRALQSAFVLGEIGAARALYHTFGKVLLVPVLVDMVQIPPVVSDLFVVRMSTTDDSVRRASEEIGKAIGDHLGRIRRGHPRVFISHRHQDDAIAQALVKVIEAAFELEPTDLRCTSVHPYKLRAGERTAERLRAELQRAEAVLGILTPDTKGSSYVLFELGASWGRGAVTFPLLARGATIADVPAPIGDLHTLSLYDEAECHQLVDDLTDVVTLRRRDRRGGLLAQCVSELVAAARA